MDKRKAVIGIKFSLFKKDPEKRRRKEVKRNAYQLSATRLAEVMAEYQKLSRKEKKQFKAITEEMKSNLSLEMSSQQIDIDLDSVTKNSPEYERLKEGIESEIALVKRYIAEHPEIPGNIGGLIVKYHVLGLGILDEMTSE